MILKYLIWKEFIQIRHNPFLLRLIVIFPIVIMCVVPWVTTLEVKNVGISVVDNDHSTVSAQLTNRIVASPYFKFKGVYGTYAEAKKAILTLQWLSHRIMNAISSAVDSRKYSSPPMLSTGRKAVSDRLIWLISSIDNEPRLLEQRPPLLLLHYRSSTRTRIIRFI